MHHVLLFCTELKFNSVLGLKLKVMSKSKYFGITIVILSTFGRDNYICRTRYGEGHITCIQHQRELEPLRNLSCNPLIFPHKVTNQELE